LPDPVIVLVERLRKEIKARQDQLTQVITSEVKDFSNYQYILGKLHAWNNIAQELTDLLKKQELDDD
tara:strand:+ start:819 stop:1019 length:201 start_codon:yes stop_codon:yes gene_type:complete